jgi:hypothetical protein
MLNAQRVRILPVIAVAGLLAGCQKSETLPSNGNTNPVNESAMPAPEVSPTATGSDTSQTPAPSSPSPASPGA